MAAHSPDSGTGNFFLDALQRTTAGRGLHVESVALHSGDVLVEPRASSEYVYFPMRSLISTTVQMQNGSAVEVGMTGREGMNALSRAFGTRGASQTAVVQIGDSAYRASGAAFHDAFDRDSGVRDLTLAFANYVFTAAAQFAACNGLHPVEQRYARWLLMAYDRVDRREFLLTQEYSAQMLGVRRASVTEVAGRLKERGLIDYDRGHVQVLNPRGLADTACECYDAVNNELKRQLGFDIGTQ